jgi:transposase
MTNAEVGTDLSPALRAALAPLPVSVKALSARIREYDMRIEELGRDRYPEVALLTQVHGVGPLIALTYILTLEDPHRFAKSRDAGCYVGLQPRRRNSGQSRPQLRISKQGDPYLRALLINSAQHMLGPFGVDSDLHRWGLELAFRGARAGKKRAIVAVARKMVVPLHRLWVSGETYEPLHRHQAIMLPAA